MEQNHSWIEASIIAFLLHILAASLLLLWLSQVAEEKHQQTYIIDLASSDFSQGSGHEGGRGGGRTTAAAEFPEPLKEEEMTKRVESVQQTQTVAHEAAAATNAESIRMFPPTKSESATTSRDTSSDRRATVGDDNKNSSMDGERGNGGGVGTGTGDGSGSSIGDGDGSGSGAGVGDGRGTGEGADNGQGTGDGDVPGAGSGPFDAAGFRAAVNANKEYPPMALKREMQGSPTIRCVLDAYGNVVDVLLQSSSGHGVLDEAAISAARAVGSYPNPTGKEVRVNITIDFYIR